MLINSIENVVKSVSTLTCQTHEPKLPLELLKLMLKCPHKKILTKKSKKINDKLKKEKLLSLQNSEQMMIYQDNPKKTTKSLKTLKAEINRKMNSKIRKQNRSRMATEEEMVKIKRGKKRKKKAQM